MTDSTDTADWQNVIETGDEEQFRTLVNPYLDMLLSAARQDIEYYVQRGVVHERDLTPEDIVGETLAYAWQHRAQCPEGMSLRGWLLGMQHRVARSLVEDIVRYRSDKALSLDEEIPPDARERGEQARRQYAGQPEVNITWEDVTPGREPRDVEAPLFTNRDTFALNPDSRHVVMMHDEFDVPLPEVATTMERTVNETAQLLDEARAQLREQKQPPEDAPSSPPNETP